MTARVFALVGNKGGIGKTTNTVNLARRLARKGRTLVVDVDAQSNSTWAICQVVLGGKHNTIYELFMDKRPLHELIRPTNDPNLFICRSSIWLSYVEAQLFNDNMRIWKLRNALRPYLNHFDYILIDTPPNVSLLTLNALMACTDVIIPVTLNGFSLLGISVILKTMKELRENAAEGGIDLKLPIFAVVVTQDRHTKDSKEHMQSVVDLFGDLVLYPTVPMTVKIEEANNKGSLYDLYPDNVGTQAYIKLVDAFLQREQEIAKDPATHQQKTDRLLANIPEPEEEQDDEEEVAV